MRVVYQQLLASDANGRVVSGKIGNARGLPFRICLTSSTPVYDGKNLTITDYLGNTGCYNGILNPYDKDTVNRNIKLQKARSYTINLNETIRTGSYCAPTPEIITADNYDVTLPGLGALGFCRNLDSQVWAAVVDDATGDKIMGARVTLSFNPQDANNSLTGTYDTQAGGDKFNLVSDKFSRVRGAPFQICAEATDYAKKCVNGTANASSKDTLLVDAKAIRLFPNKRPLGDITPEGNKDEEASYLPGTQFKGFVFDPDHSDALSVRVSLGNTLKKEFTTSQYSEQACTRYSICDQNRKVGFSVSLDELALPYGKNVLSFVAFNRAQGNQPVSEGTYVVFGQYFVNRPAPSFGSFQLGTVTYNEVNATLTRLTKDTQETIAIKACKLVNNTPSTECRDASASFAAGVASVAIKVTGLSGSSSYQLTGQTGERVLAPVTFTTPTPPPYAMALVSVSSNNAVLTLTRANVAQQQTGKLTFMGAPNKRGQRTKVTVNVQFTKSAASKTVTLSKLAPNLTYNVSWLMNNKTVASVAVTTKP